MWDAPPTLGPPAALLWALLPSFRLAGLVSFCFVLSCSVACLSLPLFASCLVSVSLRFASLAVFPLLAPSRGHLHIIKSVSGVALRGPPGDDEIAQRVLSIFKMSATSPTGTARAGGVIDITEFATSAASNLFWAPIIKLSTLEKQLSLSETTRFLFAVSSGLET